MLPTKLYRREGIEVRQNIPQAWMQRFREMILLFAEADGWVSPKRRNGEYVLTGSLVRFHIPGTMYRMLVGRTFVRFFRKDEAHGAYGAPWVSFPIYEVAKITQFMTELREVDQQTIFSRFGIAVIDS
jgi:hypothetical protein